MREALKLNLATDECVRKLNTYKRNTNAGRSRGLNLTVHLDKGRLTENEDRV